MEEKKQVSFLVGLGVFLLAVVMTYFITPWLWLFTFIIRLLFDRKSLGDWFFRQSITIDQGNNVVCDKMINVMFTSFDGYKAGKPDETISSVLGKNAEHDNLNYPGELLKRVLNKIDPNHTETSIEEDE